MPPLRGSAYATCCADTYPDTHLPTYSWAGLLRAGVSGRGKTGRKFKQSWCWDFIVSGDVYELILTRIWLQQAVCRRAGRERKEVLPFPGSSKGGNGQESPMKQSLLESRLEQRNGSIEKCHQKIKVSDEPKVPRPRISYKWLWFSSSFKLYQELLGLIAKSDYDKILKCYSSWRLVVQLLTTCNAGNVPLESEHKQTRISV